MKRRGFLGCALTLAMPFTALAQQRLFRIAIFSNAPGVIGENSPLARWRVFFTELRRLGYVEGQTLEVDRWSAEGRPSRYPEMIAAMGARKPQLIVVDNSGLVTAVQDEIQNIPVIGAVTDPLGYGFSNSLARPNRNFTGVATDAGADIYGKRMEILRDALPMLRRVAFLTLVPTWTLSPAVANARDAAAHLGVTVIPALTEEPVDAAAFGHVFAEAASAGAEAVYVHAGPNNLAFAQSIAALALAMKLATISPYRELTQAGGLLSYGVDDADNYRRLASYVDRLLKGQKVADLPIIQPERFVLAVNLKTARALGITLPESVLIRATEVIE